MKRLLPWLYEWVASARGRAARSPSGDPATQARVSVPSVAGPPAVPPEEEFFAWLLGDAAVAPGVAAEERALLDHVDVLSASESLRADLVPRARASVPQLLQSLRDETQSAQALTARVARDPNLVVEVLRLAGSVGYGNGRPVTDLTQAIGRLGTDGLRRAITRILLKPIFDAQSDPLLARTADRLWVHAEATAELCFKTAGIAQVEPFDAYLAGLMYNVGWTAAFRALGRSPGGAPRTLSPAFIRALCLRRERLFALLLQSWALSGSLDALAAEILEKGGLGAQLPLGTLLRSADRVAFLKVRRGPAVENDNP